METKTPTNNPYLDGRREWNERYGDYIAREKAWKVFSLMSILITFLAVTGVIFISSQSKIQPYIVEVSKLGEAMVVGPAQKVESYDMKVVKYMLGDFITNLRTVYKDPVIQKKMIYKAYNYLSVTFPATAKIDSFYRTNSPFTADFNTQIEISSVLPLGDKSYQIDWREKKYDPSGKLIGDDTYRATANVEIESPKNDESMMKNPLGLFIKDISIQKSL